ncbi:MAG: MATE family efflux transporter [Bacteroidales bacterium]|jgi:putative MATE family efflux protein|nr:MATE family efflux transporter [Bacteroidales bacterium]
MRNYVAFLTRNREFYPLLFKLSIPIILQGFLSTALLFVDVLMVGQLGESSVASVGLGNQFTMIFIMIANGCASGAGIFAAQYWGKRYVKHIQQTFTLGLRYSLYVGIVFSIASIFFSEHIIAFYSPDPVVQQQGGHYLHLLGISYLFFSITVVYAATLRSTKLVLLPLIASSIALSLNTVLNYCLILGHWGFPQMGVTGAGYSMIIARAVECAIIVGITRYQRLPMVRKSNSIFFTTIKGQAAYFRVVFPVIMQNLGWVVGISLYMKIYASISTAAVAAVNISETLEKMGFMAFVSMANACAIMVGNAIGAGRNDLARDYSRKLLFLGIVGAMIMGAIIIAIRPYVIRLYNLDEESLRNVSYLMLFMACVMWIKASNVIFNGGILRGGGDTKYSMCIDIGGVWLVGIPMGCIAAFVFHLPIYFVVLCIYSEEVAKMIAGFHRFLSDKWLRNLVKK